MSLFEDSCDIDDSNRKGNYIGTYNGGMFWPLDPRVEDIQLDQVIHALALNNRFNGHTVHPWTIAQHSLLVYEIQNDLLKSNNNISETHKNYLKLLALTHDFSEAYISDLVRPFKAQLEQYKLYEQAIQETFNKIFKLANLKGLGDVNLADNIALAVEAKTLMNPSVQWLEDYKFISKLYDKSYVAFIKNENQQLVKAKLTKTLFNLLNKLNIQLTGGNGYMQELAGLLEEDQLPIFDQGKLWGTLDVLSEDQYLLKNDYTTIELDLKTINNTLDLKQLTDGEMWGTWKIYLEKQLKS